MPGPAEPDRASRSLLRTRMTNHAVARASTAIATAGMKAVGINPDSALVEVIELKDHPWFIGVQYHPEYKSTVANPHPLFVAFVKAAKEFSKTKK